MLQLFHTYSYMNQTDWQTLHMNPYEENIQSEFKVNLISIPAYVCSGKTFHL